MTRAEYCIIFLAQLGRCFYCFSPLKWRYKGKIAADPAFPQEIFVQKGLISTKDHFIPTIRGGETTFENIVWACDDCNHRCKNDRMPTSEEMERHNALLVTLRTLRKEYESVINRQIEMAKKLPPEEKQKRRAERRARKENKRQRKK
jgi:hypothetical protein